MKDYIVKDSWKIIEDQFHPDINEVSESLCSIGNGQMGQRANFEEDFTGKTLQGTYVGGVYYPDKTKVGWWKNGYPEYFAKVLNSVNWIGLSIVVDRETLDLNKVAAIKHFNRTLDMKQGLLTRSFECTLQNGKSIAIESKRFVSLAQTELGAIHYTIKALNFDGKINITSYLDGDIKNKDSNYDEKFWLAHEQSANDDHMYVATVTKKTDFLVGALAKTLIQTPTEKQAKVIATHVSEKYASQKFEVDIKQGETVTILKYAVIASSRHHDKAAIGGHCSQIMEESLALGFDQLLKHHVDEWAKIWHTSDITIEGDVAAQQGIRFNIFQLYQTYTGHDAGLNIGPKGFTGEKYGGSTYWDTEAYCLPFYMATTDESVAKNLLVYRYNQLDKAIENAAKLGFTDGAALYPMVTMNGEECHNEWEITFEEIHRNGAIAYAIYDYTEFTGDHQYIKDYGIEVLIGIARFWAQRVNWSEAKKQYVMLGVTGPNEYENNVNNNWYTNYIASWCLQYTSSQISNLKISDNGRWFEVVSKTKFNENELDLWKHIYDNIYLPQDESLGIFLQQDGYMDKEQITIDKLPAKDRPLNQKWSWDRILRSCFIKQADVLQGMYFFEDHFTLDQLKKNFDFYEPRTVHESSLSPCVHSILAAKLGYKEKAYEMYLRTSRLDLDDYNNDTEDGLHITSMAGTWLSIVKGFGGMRRHGNHLAFTPFLPPNFESISFRIKHKGLLYKVHITGQKFGFVNENEVDVTFYFGETRYDVQANSCVNIPY